MTAVIVGLVGTGAAVALAGYGPALPPGALVPGGFSRVLSSATRGAEGGTMLVHVGSTAVRVVVPPFTFHVPLQVTLTTPDIARLRAQWPHVSAWRGQLLGGLALNARKPNGVLVRGRLATRTITVRLRDRSFRTGDVVLRWNGRTGRFQLMPRSRARIRDGLVTLRVNRGEEIVVLAPAD